MVMPEYEGMRRKAMVLRLERSSIHDGDGFRTVVFLKGCPLRCAWCSTPESQSFEMETAGDKTYGSEMSVEDVLKEVRKDTMFYFHSGGGMTLSGGELLAQPEFSRCLLQQARREGINTAIETTLFAQWKTVEPILQHVSTAFVDMKFYSEGLHKRYCGQSNRRILSNLRKTNDSDARFRLIVRTPLIPGLNDSEQELEKIARFCAGLNRLAHLQLLPYHRLGTDTYRKLGRKYALEGLSSPTPAHMEHCRGIVRRYLPHVV